MRNVVTTARTLRQIHVRTIRPSAFRTVLLATWTCLVLTTSGHAIIISQSQNAGTAGLGNNALDPWKGVGMVGKGPINNRDYFCTGTLIYSDEMRNKSYVLTAAHCTYDNVFDRAAMPYPGGSTPPSSSPPSYPIPNRQPTAPSGPDPFLGAFADTEMWFHLPVENAAVHYSSSAIYRHPNWVAGDDTYDIALIEVPMAINSTTWKINAGQIADELTPANAPMWGHKVGYGAGGDGRNGETRGFGLKREGRNVVDRYAGANNQLLEFDFDDHLGAFASKLGAHVAGLTEANTTHGDSGGPMFMHDGTDWRVVGVTRGGDGSGRGAGGVGFVEIANDVRVQSVAGWINQTIPEPGTLGLLLPCLLVALRSRRTARS